MSTKKILIAYHANCIDGFTSAYIVAKSFGEYQSPTDVTLLPMHYNEASDLALHKKLDEAVLPFNELYIVDFSVSVAMLSSLQVYPKLKVVVLDHHKTAFEKYLGEDYVVKPTSYFEDTIAGAYVVLDNNHSGAAMAWQFNYASDTTVPLLVMYVEDYDLWRFEYGEETRWINKYLMQQPQTLERWAEIEAALEEPATRAEVLRAGAELQAAHDKEVRRAVTHAATIAIGDYSGLFAECPYELTNDIGHELATKSGTFGLMFQWPKVPEGKVKFSLRSNGDYDITPIAKQFGGGGHKNAGGFELSVTAASKLLGDDHA